MKTPKATRMPGDHVSLSETVYKVALDLGQRDVVSSWDIVVHLVRLRPEYDGKRGVSLLDDSVPPWAPMVSRPCAEWLEEVYSLYDPNKMPVLHTRFVILGLGLVDNNLAFQLHENAIFEFIFRELHKPFESFLSKQGRELLASSSSVRPTMSEAMQIRVSRSVEEVLGKLRDRETVSSWDIARELFEIHPDYADGRGEKFLELSGPLGEEKEKSVDEWVDEVSSLYESAAVPFLDTRLFILGLSLVDLGSLSAQLHTEGILIPLFKELREPFESLLSKTGKETWTRKNWTKILDIPETITRSKETPDTSPEDTKEETPDIPDSVLTHPDRPTDEDQLGRKPLAAVLAARIRQVRLADEQQNRRGPLRISLHGKWGAGKSTLLELLKQELQSEPRPSPWRRLISWLKTEKK